MELEKDKLKVQQAGSSDSSKQTGFDAAKNIRLVPKFQEQEVDKYFLHFEKIATSLTWPNESRTLLLQSVFIGKAREIYSAMPFEICSDYNEVKQAVLKAPLLKTKKSHKRELKQKKLRVDFEPFVLEGCVSLSGGDVGPKPIKIMRDTCCAQSMILEDTLPLMMKVPQGQMH